MVDQETKKMKEDLHVLFFQFEHNYHLFDLKSDKNLPFWDVLRYEIFLDLSYDHSDISLPKSSFFSRLKKWIVLGFVTLFSIHKILFFQVNDFFLSESRVKNCKGLLFDSYFEQVLNLIDHKTLYFEMNSPFLKYVKYKRKIFDIRFLFRRFKFFKNVELSKTDEQNLIYITEQIEVFFNKKIDYQKIKKLYEDFLFDYKFFYWLLKFKKIKRVFVIQRGVQKALFLASRDLKIPTFEFQHGDIVTSTILYNYFTLDQIDLNNLSYAKYLLTFSEFWTKNKNIPSKCISIGNDLLAHVNFSNPKNKNISIICCPGHFDLLKDIAIKTSLEYPNYHILFKLHPMQYSFYTTYREMFSDYPNIQLISSHLTIHEMMDVCNDFVVIYSTVIYELIQSKKNVYIFKKLNYKNLSCYYEIENVYLFRNEIEFFALKEMKKKKLIARETPVFFKKFDKTIFLETISYV